jgi:hypothetical protein
MLATTTTCNPSTRRGFGPAPSERSSIMKTYQQSRGERRLTARAKALVGRLSRIDSDFDSHLATAKEYEIGSVETILHLLRSGPCLTTHGRKYLAQQLTQHEQWLDDLVNTSDE